jgi:hypothetical protein
MTYTHNGITFALWRWQFIEDGYAGAIYFIVPEGTYKPGSNNGASTCPMDEAIEMAKVMGINHEEDSGQMIRVSTPCLRHGEAFESREFWFLIKEAAEWADMNLTRNKKAITVALAEVQFTAPKGDA